MSLFRHALVLLALAAAGAALWYSLADDPGYVLVTHGDWAAESTLVVASLGILLAWLILQVLVWLLSSPLSLWRRQRRRIDRERLAGGLLALEEGRWARADKLLGKASRDRHLRLPALLAAHRAAFARGDSERASALLAEAGMAGGESQARLLTVEHLIERGQFESACELLDNIPDGADASPRAVELQVLALAGAGRAIDALEWLPAIRRCRIREGESLDQLERQVVAAALVQTADLDTLLTRWKSLSRANRAQPELIDAFASRADALGGASDAASAITRGLKKQWSETLALRFGLIGHDSLPKAIKKAEQWLSEHGDSHALHLTLGRLCRREQLWGKAEEHLRLALRGDVDGSAANTWEALGDLYAEQSDDVRARQAYANALRAARGEDCSSVKRITKQEALPVAAEARSSMGVPLLPGS